jgi:hypothetical protein
VSGPFTPIQTALPTHNGGVLVYNPNPNENGWRYGTPFANDWGSPTLADLNSRFGQGVYTVTVNGQAIPLNLSGSAFPNVPLLTLTGGTWAGGAYVIDVSHTLTISESDQLHSTTPGSNILTYTLPAFSLVAGQDYLAHGDFIALVDVEPNAALPGSLNFAFYEQDTHVIIRAVPEPATSFMVLAGLMSLACGRCRRAAQK